LIDSGCLHDPPSAYTVSVGIPTTNPWSSNFAHSRRSEAFLDAKTGQGSGGGSGCSNYKIKQYFYFKTCLHLIHYLYSIKMKVIQARKHN
jgi:hypothetical protein